MKAEVLMPKLGLTMTAGTVTKWFKDERDRFEAGEPLFELMTDKITYVVEASNKGVLVQKVVAEGEEAEVGEVVGYVEEAEERDTAGDVGSVSEISPEVRGLAAEREIDIECVQGTGPGEQINGQQLEVKIDNGEYSRKRPRSVEHLSGIRKTISDRLSSSMFSAPHIYLTVQVHVSELKKFRDDLALESTEKVSYNALIVKAVALALRKCPRVNSSLVEAKVYEWQDINVGLAVALEEGLVVPVVAHADEKEVNCLNREINDLVSKAREGRLGPEDISGGTFTVSNLGAYEIESFTAIINPPESAILAVGAIQEGLVPVGGKAEVRSTMKMTLSADHRLIDGAVAATFLKHVKTYLECPQQLL